MFKTRQWRFVLLQVSFFSTSPELSNKQRFEFFSRTIPSDHYQVKAMVEIVGRMGWSYVSIIYEESNYGIKVRPNEIWVSPDSILASGIWLRLLWSVVGNVWSQRTDSIFWHKLKEGRFLQDFITVYQISRCRNWESNWWINKFTIKCILGCCVLVPRTFVGWGRRFGETIFL